MTNRGQAKILDFGVAKVTIKAERASLSAPTIEAEEHLISPGSLLGTVAYMSPEQIQGKELDSRSDVFSFGSVLYEMCTGVLPFRGETSALIFNAILELPPVAPARLNPDIPAALENIILKALEKDRNVRCQSAAELAADLKRLKRDTDSAASPDARPRSSHSPKSRLLQRWHLLAASILLAIAAMFLGYHSWYRPSGQVPTNSLNLRQLTSSSSERFISSAVISPDGKYLAYTEYAGPLILSLIESGETRILIPASGDIAAVGWFPDGTQLLVLKTSEHSIWKVSVLTGALSKIRDNVGDARVSPDGSHLAYWDQTDRELWITGSDGERSRRVMVDDPDNESSSFSWAPTGRRFAYVTHRHRPNGKEDILIESRDVETPQLPTVILSASRGTIMGLCWLSDGRLIYSLTEPPPNENDSNLWAIRVDSDTSKSRGNPVRLTNWTGFTAESITATAAGKRLLFLKSQYQISIYIAPLGKGEKSGLGTAQRLMTDTWQKGLDGWTLDSRAVYLSLHRDGKTGIYRQGTHQQALERVVSGSEGYANAHLSADGSLLLYTAFGKEGISDQSRLMSMPIEGGTPSVLANGSYEYECALPPSTACVLSEEKGEALNFYSLDPKRGPTSAPFKTTKKIGFPHCGWSLSPDGKLIALVEDNEQDQVQVLNVSKGTVRRLALGKWTHLQTISWSPDGKTLYVSSLSSPGATLLSVGLDGSVTTLFQHHTWLCCPKAAPNHQLLAYLVAENESDAVMIENF